MEMLIIRNFRNRLWIQKDDPYNLKYNNPESRVSTDHGSKISWRISLNISEWLAGLQIWAIFDCDMHSHIAKWLFTSENLVSKT